jgi:hypothetical protein
VGNHGAYEPVVDPSSNYFFNAGISGITSPFDATGTRTTPQDASFSQIEEVRSGATSNDNTLAVSLQHNSKYLTVQANYTWQYALDEISNGGFLPFAQNTNQSIFAPINPLNLKDQYANADNDVRNNFTLAYVLTVPMFYGPRVISDGWQLSGTVIAHGGAPYSIIDGATTGASASKTPSA